MRRAGSTTADQNATTKGELMGRPVVHFEVMGKDGEKLRGFYAELFGWAIDADNPLDYGVVRRETNVAGDGIPGGIGALPGDMPGHVTFYVEVPDVETALAQAERLGGRRLMGPAVVQAGRQPGRLR